MLADEVGVLDGFLVFQGDPLVDEQKEEESEARVGSVPRDEERKA